MIEKRIDDVQVLTTPSGFPGQSGICGNHGGPTIKMTVLKRPDENLLVPETSVRVQGRGVQTLMA